MAQAKRITKGVAQYCKSNTETEINIPEPAALTKSHTK